MILHPFISLYGSPNKPISRASSFIHLLGSFIQSFVNSFTSSFIHSFIHSFTCFFISLFVHLSVFSFGLPSHSIYTLLHIHPQILSIHPSIKSRDIIFKLREKLKNWISPAESSWWPSSTNSLVRGFTSMGPCHSEVKTKEQVLSLPYIHLSQFFSPGVY